MFPATGGVVAVGKNCDPTGVAVEQASNIARGTPTISAESRQLNTMPRHREVPEHAGPMRPGVPRAPFEGDEAKRNEAEGVSRADIRIGNAELCLRGLFENRIGTKPVSLRCALLRASKATARLSSFEARDLRSLPPQDDEGSSCFKGSSCLTPRWRTAGPAARAHCAAARAPSVRASAG